MKPIGAITEPNRRWVGLPLCGLDLIGMVRRKRRWHDARCHVGRWLLTGFLTAILGGHPYAAARAADRPAPQRIVSLNLCLDPLVLGLVERSRIAALTALAADPTLSTISGDVAGLTLLRGTAEEVLALDPDLILAGTWTTGPTVDLLRRLGRRVVVVPLPNSIADIAATIRTVAAATGAQARGEAMIAAFEHRLALAIPSTDAGTAPGSIPRPPSALVYHVNGLVSGGGSMLDEALTRAGWRNAAADHQLGRGGRLDLEAIVASPPDLVVLAQTSDTYRTVAADNVRHPALRQLLRTRPSLVLPMPLWLCGTPAIADAVAELSRVRTVIGATR